MTVDFIVRILFSGLMAFVPSQDGKELTVLLLSVDHGYHVADGTPLPHHKAMVLARANCAGDCPKRNEGVASYIYNGVPAEIALDSLEAAVGNGAVWELSGCDLFVRKGSSRDPELQPLVIQHNVRASDSIVPANAREREDYTWVASAGQVCPTCVLDPAYLTGIPPKSRVVARFRLRSGKAFTYAVSRQGTNVTPVHFARLDGTGTPSAYTQAVANWVAADIRVSAQSIELVEQTFAGTRSRSMNLAPGANGKVEIAVLNMPPYVPPVTRNMGEPEPGKHFEVYYDLAQNPPARATRLLPHAGTPKGVVAPEVNWQFVHPQDALYSELLNKLRLDLSRSAAEPAFCPASGWP
jgi:hypothetical protein